MEKGDKSLLFIIISCVCFWLVLDEIYGKKLIAQFILNIMPSAKSKTVADWFKDGTGTGDWSDIEDRHDQISDEIDKDENDQYAGLSDYAKDLLKTWLSAPEVNGITQSSIKLQIKTNIKLTGDEKKRMTEIMEAYWAQQ